MKNIKTIFIAAAVAVLTFFAGRGCGGGRGGCDPGGGIYTEARIDTLVVRDTVRDTVLVPVERYIVRVDTVWLDPVNGKAVGDNAVGEMTEEKSPTADSMQIALPIEQKVYATEDYRAVVEGFRPALVEMEFYPKTTFVTRETIRVKAPERWGIGIQAGYGFSPKGAVPYIGLGVQYRILAW